MTSILKYINGSKINPSDHVKYLGIFLDKNLAWDYHISQLCGSLCRHPHNDFDEFFKYLESCLSILAKENKEVYICGG